MKRIAPLLFTLSLFLSACASPAASTSAPVQQAEATSTSQPTALPATNTATATSTPTPTSLPTFTPEPGWYQTLDPSLQMLKYSYAQVTNLKARVYVTVADAVASTGRLPQINTKARPVSG